MNKRNLLACFVILALIVFSVSVRPTYATEDEDIVVHQPADNHDGLVEQRIEQEDVLEDKEAIFRKKTEAHAATDAFLGYRVLSRDGHAFHAAEYDYLHSGLTGGASLNYLGNDLKLGMDGAVTNSKDYSGDLLFDYAGYYRFHLRTESFFHNLESDPLPGTSFFTLPDPTKSATYEANDASNRDVNGLKVEQNTATFRIKMHDFPLHFNFGYWRFVKEGTVQQIFSDIAFKPTRNTLDPVNTLGTTNTLYAKSRPVNSRVDEGNIGFDSHLGPVDLIYNFVIRQFEDNTTIPRDNFPARVDISGINWGQDGLRDHNEDPDNRYMAHTVKLHTSLSGGIVGAASYTLGTRENMSRLTDIQGADRTRSTLQNIAGDLNFTPIKELTLGLKFRRQQNDNDNPLSLTTTYTNPSSVPVRPSFDTEKNVITATLLYRPMNQLTLKGEYRGEFLKRDDIDRYYENLGLNKSEDSHRGTLSINSRLVKDLKLRAQYSYLATNNPSYGTSSAEKQEGDLFASYNLTNRWGINVNYRNIRENNSQITRSLISLPESDPLSFIQNAGALSREKTVNHLTTAVWFVPVQKLTISANYGLLRNVTDQLVLFSSFSTPDNTVTATQYRSQAQIYGLSATYLHSEKLDLNLVVQQIYAFSEFNPIDKSFGTSGDTSGVKEISRLKTVESSLSTRVNYKFVNNLACSLEYSLRDYIDKYDSLHDGTVQTITAMLSSKW